MASSTCLSASHYELYKMAERGRVWLCPLVCWLTQHKQVSCLSHTAKQKNLVYSLSPCATSECKKPWWTEQNMCKGKNKRNPTWHDEFTQFIHRCARAGRQPCDGVSVCNFSWDHENISSFLWLYPVNHLFWESLTTLLLTGLWDHKLVNSSKMFCYVWTANSWVSTQRWGKS